MTHKKNIPWWGYVAAAAICWMILWTDAKADTIIRDPETGCEYQPPDLKPLGKTMSLGLGFPDSTIKRIEAEGGKIRKINVIITMKPPEKWILSSRIELYESALCYDRKMADHIMELIIRDVPNYYPYSIVAGSQNAKPATLLKIMNNVPTEKYGEVLEFITPEQLYALIFLAEPDEHPN
ncbi:hypothetical protein KKF61_06225 [Patescibacteria group bacterium]|nr:hypothetical protein [Patescibacteria group bacterium]